jgi:hypothetical protein
MKIDRQAVYDKYQGHCAYCGKEIEFKEMQIDHIAPIHWTKTGKVNERLKPIMAMDKGINNEKNLNPSCKRCNHYKRGLSLEVYRTQLKTLHERIEKQYINKVGIDYGIIILKPWDGEFYFEYYDKCEKRYTNPNRSLL